MPDVEFHFDFGSPNAYLAHLVIPSIERRTGATFTYVPVLLGGVFKLTNNRSPAESLAGIKNKPEYQRLETARFVKRHGITCFAPNPFFPVNTLVLMRGAIAAQRLDLFGRYVGEVFRHMWAEPKKLDDHAVLRAALLGSGFDADRLLALTAAQDVKGELLANTQRSVERGTFGSPTFFVGGKSSSARTACAMSKRRSRLSALCKRGRVQGPQRVAATPASCPLRRSRASSAQGTRCRTSPRPGTSRRRTTRPSCVATRRPAPGTSIC
jgi:2-hydroxychromene-2-carboxylate isomerase